jgi:predicted MFS family arabinose efflux permease
VEPFADDQHGAEAAIAGRNRKRRRLTFAVVSFGYLAVTLAESLLAPLYPVLGSALGLGLGSAGLAFSLLAASIAIGNVAGGFLLQRRGPRVGASLGLGVTAAGALLAATSSTRGIFLMSQVVLGLGSGGFFASGLSAAALLAGERRRGIAIGFFGVAFSGGLAGAAVLAAAADRIGWQGAFAVAAGIAAGAAVAAVVSPVPRHRPAPSPLSRGRLRAVLGAPLAVGGVASVSQYGTVAFLPAFAVHVWGLSPVAAALMLAVARVLSVPAKLVSGNTADRSGAIRVARRLGLFLALLGAWWTLGPGPGGSLWAAVLFAAFVSGLGPVANLLAFEGFGNRGPLLGVFRAAQIGLAAATTAAIGALSTVIGLRAALVVAAVLPALLLVLPAGRSGNASRRSE